MSPTPITKLNLDGREFFVKRDESIDLYLSGNKYRKLYTLLQTPKSHYRKIISYGGTQSNAMLSLAALAKEKKWEFTYYTKPLSEQLKMATNGNYFEALRLGMIHKEVEEPLYRDSIASLHFSLEPTTLLVDQGGASMDAKAGIEVLAQEILSQSSLGFNAVATPSGTGTTALFLAQALPNYRVYTTPCVGNATYLKNQMSALGDIPKNLTILEPQKKYHFAKPYKEFYEIYKKLQNVGVSFDLLYAPSLWLELINKTQERILYVHSGGLIGNQSMLERYKHKFPTLI